MADYTQIGKGEINELVSLYDLGRVDGFENLSGGQANSSLTLRTTEGTFVLSICDEKSMDEARGLADLLIYLEAEGFRTTRVVRAKDGRPVAEYDGKPVIIKRYIEGVVHPELTSGMIFQLGRELARLHRIPAPDWLPPAFAYGVQCFPEVIASEADENFSAWLDEKKTLFESSIRPDLPRGLVHGDVFYDNTLFDGETLVAIIDFEEACHYYNMFDLGMCAAGTCTEGGLVSLEKAGSLVRGYESIRALEPAEKDLFQVFIEYGAAATAFWRFRQYNLIKPGHEKSATFLEMKAIVDQIHAVPSNVFGRVVFQKV